jgi:2-iminobutanoate/2-iminopropanoate deaminase
MTKDTIISDKLPAPKGPYSPAIRANGFVFVSGQGPLDPKTGEVFRGDIGEQTRLVLENIRAILAAAGSSLHEVVKTNVYLTDIADFAAMNEVYATFFPSEPPLDFARGGPTTLRGDPEPVVPRLRSGRPRVGRGVEGPPARTTIQAAALPLGISVEIDVIALA